MKQLPIGIFDSGIGGLTVWQEIYTLLPYENYIYLSDSKNSPYGTKSKTQIEYISKDNVDWLIDKGVKLIVIACNTATTNAITQLRKIYKIPFVGIEPVIKPAIKLTKTKKIGVIATKGTIESSLFNLTSEMYGKGVVIFKREGKGLVELIERGLQNSNEVKQILIKLTFPMVEKDIDCLILGCTHYHLLKLLLKSILPKKIHILDPSEAVARQTKAILNTNRLITTKMSLGKCDFYSNGDLNILKFITGDKNEFQFHYKK